ncbi:MAG: alkaline phosphatase family protein [Planctomycetota bacterium]
MRSARALALALLLAGFALAAARAEDPPRGRENDKHVIVISIDALRPEFYLSDAWKTPTLKALAAKGAKAQGVEPAYPSVTYAGHASIVTGMKPARHGVYGNTVFDDELGPQPEWIWETKSLTAKPIWQAAKEQGRKVALIMWPTSVGAQVDWLVPERWAVRGESTRDILLKSSTPGLLLEIALALGVAKIDSSTLQNPQQVDEFVSGGVAHVIETRKPNLLFVHLIQVDSAAHANGRDAEQVKAAVERTDANVAKIIEATKKAGIHERTVFVIVGDHGFTDVKETLAPNALLAKAGLVDRDDKGNVKAWRALGHAHGGSMAIHARDEASAAKARAILEKAAVANGETLYRIIERPELDALGANPKAAFWLEGAEYMSFAGGLDGDLIQPARSKHGTHGGLPARKQLHTGFIASGPGVRVTTVEHMRLIDVAPTLARLMGIDFPAVDGAVLDVLADEPY